MEPFRFGVFTLDPARYVVLRGGKEIALRPKAFDVLEYLVQRAGTVVTKEELFEAVWGGAARTDGSLVQCIRHIREALGDNDHRIIRAVPKRGYLFAADVSPAEVAPSAAAAADRPSGATAAPPASRLAAAARRLPRVGRSAAVAALTVAVLAAAAGGGWILTGQAPTAKAAHYAILARAVLDKERSADASRKALSLYGRALALDPDHVPALLGYARVLLVDHFEKWAPRGERAVRLGQAEAAVARAIELDPESARAYYNRGKLWRARRAPERAIAALERALALDPTYAWAHAEIGRSKIDVGRAEEAIEHIETALRLGPDERRRHVWYFWAGLAALHAGKDAAALEWLMKVRAGGHRRPRLALAGLAVAYAALGREDEGRVLMAEYLVRAPRATVSSLGDALARRNNAVVAPQRERIAALLRRLGVPEGNVGASATDG